MQTVKFHPDLWKQVEKGKSVKCTRFSHLRLQAEGNVEVDLGNGYQFVVRTTECKLELPAEGRVRCTEAFAILETVDVGVKQQGVPLTNFDKRSGVSAAEAMVRRALREKAIKEQSQKIARDAANRALNKKRVEEGLQEADPTEPQEPEPQSEPDTDEVVS